MAIQNALNIVGMGGSHSLSFEIDHAGANLSAGERQLVCVARALLTKSRVVVLAEASSYVDYERDKRLQRALRIGLAESTVTIIAHRLHTSVQCDYVLVLDDGEAVEGPRPALELLGNEKSRLFALARELGGDTIEELCASAAAWQN